MTWMKHGLSLLSSICVVLSEEEEENEQTANTGEHGSPRLDQDKPRSYTSTGVQTINPPEFTGTEMRNLRAPTSPVDYEAQATPSGHVTIFENKTSILTLPSLTSATENTHAASAVASSYEEGFGRLPMECSGSQTVVEQIKAAVLPRSNSHLEESTFGRASMLAIVDNSSDSVSLYSAHTSGQRGLIDTINEGSAGVITSQLERMENGVELDQDPGLDAPHLPDIMRGRSAGPSIKDMSHPPIRNEKLQGYLDILKEASISACSSDTINMPRENPRLENPAESDGTDPIPSLAISRTTPAGIESSFTSLDVLIKPDLDNTNLQDPQAQIVKVYRINEWTKHLGEATAPQAQRWSFIQKDSEYVEEESVRILSPCFSYTGYTDQDVHCAKAEQPLEQTWQHRADEKGADRRPTISEHPSTCRRMKPPLRHFSSLQDMPRMQCRSSAIASFAPLNPDCNPRTFIPRDSEHRPPTQKDEQPLTNMVTRGTVLVPSGHTLTSRGRSPHHESLPRPLSRRPANSGGHKLDTHYLRQKATGKEMTLPERRHVVRYASHESLRNHVFKGSLVPVVDARWLGRSEERRDIFRQSVDNHRQFNQRQAEALQVDNTIATSTKHPRSVCNDRPYMRKAMVNSAMQDRLREPRVLDVCNENDRYVEDVHMDR